MDLTKLTPLLLTGFALYALWRFGGPEGKGMALGVAGYMAINQIPGVRDGVQTRLVA